MVVPFPDPELDLTVLIGGEGRAALPPASRP